MTKTNSKTGFSRRSALQLAGATAALTCAGPFINRA
jgi:hypothetical protein